MTNGSTYTIANNWGFCKICLQHHDLRCGVCFTCAATVRGQRLDENRHLLWSTKNSQYKWIYNEQTEQCEEYKQ